jgi:hypothetical protein
MLLDRVAAAVAALRQCCSAREVGEADGLWRRGVYPRQALEGHRW